MTDPNHSHNVGVGIIGTGFAALAHLDAVSRTPGVTAKAIAGRDRERTERIARQHGLRSFTDYMQLLEDPAVDAVHTCTVNRLHHEVNLAALRHRKHVLSEKPLAVDSRQSAELAEAAAEAAAESNVVAGVCFNYRHYPMVAQIASMLDSGEYGTPHFVHGHYLQDWLLSERDWNWRVDQEQGGRSRAVADIGSHWADLVQHVTGDAIDEVFADLTTLHNERWRPKLTDEAQDMSADLEPVTVRSEDFGAVLVRFRSGARGAFHVSQTSAGHRNSLRFQVDATHAALAWDQEQPERVWVGRRPGPNLELMRDPDALHPRAARLARLPAGHPEGWADALRNVVGDFYESISNGRGDSELASFETGHSRVALVDAVLESAREERWAQVKTGSQVSA